MIQLSIVDANDKADKLCFPSPSFFFFWKRKFAAAHHATEMIKIWHMLLNLDHVPMSELRAIPRGARTKNSRFLAATAPLHHPGGRQRDSVRLPFFNPYC